jgi:hypothetical protein
MCRARFGGLLTFYYREAISEVGLEMARWETEGHFASWLGLCPDSRITGARSSAGGPGM